MISFAIGIVGDAGVRGTAQQPRLYVGMILILIFAEVLGESRIISCMGNLFFFLILPIPLRSVRLDCRSSYELSLESPRLLNEKCLIALSNQALRYLKSWLALVPDMLFANPEPDISSISTSYSLCRVGG